MQAAAPEILLKWTRLKLQTTASTPRSHLISICPECGCALQETSGSGEMRCTACLLRVGIGGEDNVLQDATLNDFEGGARFGVYEIDRREDGSVYEIGRGAMGTTYRAIDMTLQRTVALKIINFGIAARSAQARQRFLREARSAAALRHENIATVFQFGIREETGQCFYAMELIDGETLEQRVRRTGPLSEPAAIHLAQQVASALAAAEKRGLIHRDLKPANLMLVSSDDQTPSASRQRCDYNNARELVATPRNHRARRDAIGANDTDQKPLVKIIDFGLAKALNAPVGPTRLTHNSFVGTPVFASPEQFNHSRLDVRSDIYSLGVTLWFALTGKTPFGRHSIEEIRRAQRGNALPIEQLKAARVRSSLRSLLKSMLEFESAARPGTHELAAKLQACAAQATGVRHPRIVLGAAALVLGISAFLFVAHLAGTRRLSLESGRRRERHCRAAD